MHAGEVVATSALGKGSTFTVTILSGRAHLSADQVEFAPLESSISTGAALYVEEARRWDESTALSADDNVGEFAAMDRGAANPVGR